jgi:hypothetical protein
VPSTATRIDTPSTKPSWRVIAEIAEPAANRSRGSDAAAALARLGSVVAVAALALGLAAAALQPFWRGHRARHGGAPEGRAEGVLPGTAQAR